MKTCFRCNRTKALDEFYRHPATADGYLGECRECTKARVRANYARRRKQYSAYNRRRNQTVERKASCAERRRRLRDANPEKYRARTAVNNAIRDGRLTRQPCWCGKRGQAHHDDYSKPLEVRWLCFEHHRAEHGQVVVTGGS